MAGIIIPILPKTRFDFSFLAANASKTVVVQPALNLIPFKSARLLVRVHDIQNSGSGTLTLAAFSTAPSPSDPSEFTASTSVLSVVVNSSSSTGDLLTATDSDIAPFLKITLAAAQDPTAQGTLYAELSADLVVREN